MYENIVNFSFYELSESDKGENHFILNYLI